MQCAVRHATYRLHRWWGLLLVVCLLSGSWVASPALVQGATGPDSAVVHLVQSDAYGAHLRLTTPPFEIGTHARAPATQREWQQIVLAEAAQSGSIGTPALPTFAVLLAVPADATPILKIATSSRQIYPAPVWLAPVPTPQPSDDPLQPGVDAYLPDPLAYASPASLPATPARITADLWQRDQRIVRIELTPFVYTPATGSLAWYSQLEVSVDFGTTGAPPATPPAPDPYAPALDLLNAQQAQAWRTPAPTLAQVAAPDPTPRYRIEITADGVYQITGAELAALGLALDTTPPERLHLICGGQPTALLIEREAGSPSTHLTAQDRLLFYATQFRGSVMEEKYTQTNVCWLAVRDTDGTRMTTRRATPDASLPLQTTFSETVRAERSLTWFPSHFTSEETWFWQRIQTDGTQPARRTYSIALPDPATSPYSATVRGELVSRAYAARGQPNYHTRAELNGALVADAFWGKGEAADVWRFAGTLPHTAVRDGNNQLALTIFNDAAVSFNDMLFDWFEVSYLRRLIARNNQLTFTAASTAAAQLQLEGFLSDDLLLLDISDPAAPVLLTDALLDTDAQGFRLTFATSSIPPTQPPARFIALARAAVRAPAAISRYTPPDLGSTRGADYIIITHATFRTAVQRLADYRAAQGLRVAVVDIADLYNQFNNGIVHPRAIRSFLAYTMQAWQPPAPAMVLLVGDGHWNMLNHAPASYGGGPVYIPPYLAWVDPYQGETDATSRLAMLTNDVLPDMAIGRLPVNSVAELNTIIDATLQFEQLGTLPPAEQPRNVVMVADNIPDPAGNFVAQSEQIIARSFTADVPYARLYLNDFCPRGGACPALNTVITAAINNPQTLFLGYNGHAAIERWAAEGIWQVRDLAGLTNQNRRPLVIAMTCLEGYWHYPNRPGLSESALRSEQGGIVAAYTPTGLGVATGHDWLQHGFFTAVYKQRVPNLGAAVHASKVALYLAGVHADLLDTFGILGDPALRLPTATVLPEPSEPMQRVYLPLVRAE